MKINKKNFPVVAAVSAVVIIAIGLFIFKRGGGNQDYRTLSLEESPYVRLVPREDGHWLKLIIANFEVSGAATLDYELIYDVPGLATQGVPGTIEIDGSDTVERDLLLGSESSGNFRYDEDVEAGTLNLNFRSSNGKLLAELSSDWRLLKDTTDIFSADGDFNLVLDEPNSSHFIVVMSTFGLPMPLENAKGVPYGAFSSGGEPYPGTLDFGDNVVRWDGDGYRDVEGDTVPNIGTFVQTSN